MVDLLEITIDNHLSFKKHIENLRLNVNYILHALRRIRKCLTVEEANKKLDQILSKLITLNIDYQVYTVISV